PVLYHPARPCRYGIDDAWLRKDSRSLWCGGYGREPRLLPRRILVACPGSDGVLRRVADCAWFSDSPGRRGGNCRAGCDRLFSLGGCGTRLQRRREIDSVGSHHIFLYSTWWW